ncbi:MAG: hypothetical protein ACOZAR_02915 [Patescibacteria group bacterium]
MEQTNEGQMNGWGNNINTSATIPTNQTPGSMPTKSLRSIGDLFSQSWQLTLKKFLTIFLIQLVPAAINVMIVVTLLMIMFGAAGLIAVITDNDTSLALEKMQAFLSSSTLIGGSFVMIFVTVVSASFILSFFQIWSYAAMIAEVNCVESKGFFSSYKDGWSKLFQYWWIGLIVGAAIFGGSILLVIPGIIFAVWFNYAEFILFSENITGARAVARSKKYVEGYWWDVFARIVLLVIVSIIVIAIVNLVTSILFGILSALSGDNTILSLVLNIIDRLVTFVITTLVLTFSYNYQYLIYKNLKEIKGSLPETVLSTTQKWLYNGAPAIFLLIILMIILFAGYAIWFTLDKLKTPLTNLNSIEEEMRTNLEEEDLTPVPTFDTGLPKTKSVSDNKLDTTAENLQTALETFYTVKGFYPYTEKIDALWTGEERILDKKMSLDECGEINTPTSKCGLYYQWVDKDNYKIIITHTDGEQTILTSEESESTDLTKPTI